MKLNLASGTDLKDSPWINLDIVARWPNTKKGCEIIWDARKDKIPFTDNSADTVYAGHLLLHLAPKFHKFVLSEIIRVLEPGGFLIVGEVDMQIVMQKYLNDPYDTRTSELIWGEQGVWEKNQELSSELIEFDKHCQGFTQESLGKILIDSGFVNLRRVKIHSDEVWYELTIECQVPENK